MTKHITWAALLLTTATWAAPQTPFKASDVDAQAKKLAQSKYIAPPEVGESLQKLNYDQHSQIQYKSERAVWKKEKLPFQLQFFYPGSYFHTTVQVFTVKGATATPVAFSNDLFNVGPNVPPLTETKNLGFAGFRVHYALNKADKLDDLLSFLGASYFRSMGKGEWYGLSARGVAIDTAEPSGEEFPAFRKFWVETPTADGKELVIHALLDSPSLTGAYHFTVRPGETTLTDVTGTLFTRKSIQRLGIAPITSMYLFGENHRGPPTDFHPEVHDSDGLLLWDGTGERLWRPLDNPSRLQVASFQAKHPKGFGLLQRDQSFSSYEDLSMYYERRPSLWVEPQSGFDDGAVTLVEIPSQADTNDNMGAFWVPQKAVAAEQTLHFAYRLHWGSNPVPALPISEIKASFSTASSSPNRGRFVIDFTGPKSGGKLGEGKVEPSVTLSRGTVLNAKIEPNPTIGGWRVTFEFEAEGSEPVEMRCFLKQGQSALSETWSYLWTH